MSRDFIAVDLKKRTVKGKYTYYFLYWSDSNGKPRRKNLGNTKKLSKRQAKLLRVRMERKLNQHPAGRDAGIAPTLSEFLNKYEASRKEELAPGTRVLHQQTIRYLLGYFRANQRIDEITKTQARAFKTALANGGLMHKSKRPRMLGPVTVNLHIRNAKTFFNQAAEDEIITDNPFGKLVTSIKIEKSWHYVTPEEYQKLIDAAPNMSWKLLISLCRLAGLRRGEALNLEWSDIDFEKHLIKVIAKNDWVPKDKAPRTVPVFHELYNLLLSAQEIAKVGQLKVIEKMAVKNLWRDFYVICRRAGVQKYNKPFHSLRKNAISDWAAGWPAHVVREWAGHSDFETTDRHYLQVSEAEYNRAAAAKLFDFAQLSAQNDKKKDLTKIKDVV